MGVCRVTATDYLYTSRFGSELCPSGQSLTVTETLQHPGALLIKMWATCRTQLALANMEER